MAILVNRWQRETSAPNPMTDERGELRHRQQKNLAIHDPAAVSSALMAPGPETGLDSTG
jgi:hypothetical protein